MPWVRLDDHFDEHPKLAEVGPLGLALWVAGLAYCNRNLTDGFIPRRVAHSLLSFEGIGVFNGMQGQDVTCEMVAGMLVDARLWEHDGRDYRVHDYLEFQRSKAEILADQANKVAAGKRGGQASAQARAQASAQAEFKQEPSRHSSKKQADAQAEFNPNPMLHGHDIESSNDRESHSVARQIAATPDAGAPARVRKKRKPPERSKEEAALMGVFCEATGLHMPHAEKDTNWWFSELKKVVDYAEGDDSRAKALVREVVAEMQGRDPPLTITSPKSIVGMANAWAAENGNGNNQRAPATKLKIVKAPFIGGEDD